MNIYTSSNDEHRKALYEIGKVLEVWSEEYDHDENGLEIDLTAISPN